MRKYLHPGFCLFLVFSFILFNTCESSERDKAKTYDLFPLKAGNEFYYKYYKYRFSGISAYTEGSETWRVISESSSGNINIYRIERKLNAILTVAGQTISISDSLRYFEINEDKTSSLLSSSSMILFKEISFKRFQSNPQIEIKQEGSSMKESWSYLFKADSGLIKYSYYHPPNQITNETLHLDSMKTFN